MKILCAADGSKFTKKALAFLVTHPGLVEPGGELVVLNVQPAFSAGVRRMAGAAAVRAYQEEEAAKVLAPIRKFLDRHDIAYSARWTSGDAASEIVRVAAEEKAHLVAMGTHGHGALGRAVLGSVAQKVLVSHVGATLLIR